MLTLLGRCDSAILFEHVDPDEYLAPRINLSLSQLPPSVSSVLNWPKKEPARFGDPPAVFFWSQPAR